MDDANTTHKILAVEDDKFYSKAYAMKFKKEGFDITIANNGEEAISILKEGFIPDLILLDIIMPKKDGLEVLKEIRNIEALNNVNVIITSNLSQAEERSKALELGATDYFVKSDITMDELIAKVRNYLT